MTLTDGFANGTTQLNKPKFSQGEINFLYTGVLEKERCVDIKKGLRAPSVNKINISSTNNS